MEDAWCLRLLFRLAVHLVVDELLQRFRRWRRRGRVELGK